MIQAGAGGDSSTRPRPVPELGRRAMEARASGLLEQPRHGQRGATPRCPAIAEDLANLRLTGDEALCAGVIVGWETAIGRDVDTGRDLGYCALTNLGFTANSRLRTSTARSNPWFKTGSKPGQAVWPRPAYQATESTRISHLLPTRTGLQTVPMHAIRRRRSRSRRPTVRGSTYPDGDRFRQIYEALISAFASTGADLQIMWS